MWLFLFVFGEKVASYISSSCNCLALSATACSLPTCLCPYSRYLDSTCLYFLPIYFLTLYALSLSSLSRFSLTPRSSSIAILTFSRTLLVPFI